MHVALIADYCAPVYVGGAEYSVEHLVGWLGQRLDVTVVTPNYGAGQGQGNVRRYPVPFRRVPVPYALLANPAWYLYSAWQVARQSKDADVLHCQGKHHLVGAWLAARWLRLPCVATLRDYQPLCRYGLTFDDARAQWPRTPAGLYYRLDGAFKRWVLRHYDQVIVLSEAMRRIYAQHGVEAQVIHNTVAP